MLTRENFRKHSETTKENTDLHKQRGTMKTFLKLMLVVILLLFGGIEDGNGYKRILRTRHIRRPKSPSFDCKLKKHSPDCNEKSRGRKRREIKG